MRIAVISDIHANPESSRGILTNIEDSNIDTVVCLGDNNRSKIHPLRYPFGFQ